MAKPGRILAAAAMVAVLGFAAFAAGRSCLGDIYAGPTESYLDEKRNTDQVLSEAEWQALQSVVAKALAASSGDPLRLSELGRLYRIRLEPDGLEREEIARIGDRATEYYEAALLRRPTWPSDWANLAQVKFEQYEESSDIYSEALVHAIEFGPHEPYVQRVVAENGIDTWDALSPAAQSAVLDAVEHALERESNSVSSLFEFEEYAITLCANAGTAHEAIKNRCAALDLT